MLSRVKSLALMGLITGGGFLSTACGLIGQRKEAAHDVRAQQDLLTRDNPFESTAAPCEADLLSFAKEVWQPLIRPNCAGCHTPGGYAEQAASKLVIAHHREPDFLTTNRNRLYAQGDHLLRKVDGREPHQGGVIFAPGSAGHTSLEKFLTQERPPEDCRLSFDAKLLAPERGVLSFYSDQALLRKVGLQLAGRLPTPQERERVSNEGLNGVLAVLDTMMQEEEFLDWVRQTYNDMLLTDRYLQYVELALDGYRFKNYRYFESMPEGKERSRTEISMVFGAAREGLELVKHVVRNNKPLTEILTADYMMVSPFTAPSFLGNDHGINFRDNKDPFEFAPAVVPLMYGHAGLLSSHSLLFRFPTTESNRNRLRARMIYKTFLDTDVLDLDNRSPSDLTKMPDPQSPTMTHTSCVGCHSILDPVASAYQHYPKAVWDERYQPWHNNMLPAGFESERLSAEQVKTKALPWLAQKIAADPRFALASVRIVYSSLVGRPPLDEPSLQDPHYDTHLRAYTLQRQIFNEVAKAFVDSNYNFKTLVRELVKSPYYRANGLNDTISAEAKEAYASFGTARRRTPEDLHRMFVALTGITWTSRSQPLLAAGPIYVRRDRMAYNVGWTNNLLLGGIDSNDVTERAPTGNAIMAKTELEMARDMACKAVAHDFMLPRAERRLFPFVETNMLPTDPKALAAIMANLRYLHRHLIDEDLAIDHPELAFSYDLFLNSWTKGMDRIRRRQQGATELSYNCRVEYFDDFGVGPNGSRGEMWSQVAKENVFYKDPDYTIRAWAGVVAMLMADFRFLYD